MKPVDTVNPALPSNRLRRVEDRRKERDQKNPPNQGKDPPRDLPPGGRNHLIDELA
jgi:hypothetical protein